MRFVQQNTCVTQRVTVDVGGVARLVIPCFEGITTVSDLVETVHCRFPTFNITGLRQPGTKIGKHAWDAHHHRIEQEGEAGGGAALNTRAVLNPHDFVSVAVGSDAALIAVGFNIPVGGREPEEEMVPMTAREEEEQREEVQAAAAASRKRISELTGGDGGGGADNDGIDPLHHLQPESDMDCAPSVSAPPVSFFRHSMLKKDRSTTDTTEEEDQHLKQPGPSTPTQARHRTSPQVTTTEDMQHKKQGSAMAMAVS